MPSKTVHCSICRKAIIGYDFKERMAKLRRHRKKEHPKAHKESVAKSQKSRKSHDPEIKVRKKLIATPTVKGFIDYKGSGLVRVLDRRPESNLFPEFALYVKFRMMPHNLQDQMLKDAGFTEEQRGKWVQRTNKFSVFLYV